jgi:hypothetical protein
MTYATQFALVCHGYGFLPRMCALAFSATSIAAWTAVMTSTTIWMRSARLSDFGAPRTSPRLSTNYERKRSHTTNRKTYTQEIPQWSGNTRKLAVECKTDCATAANALKLLLPWKIEA